MPVDVVDPIIKMARAGRRYLVRLFLNHGWCRRKQLLSRLLPINICLMKKALKTGTMVALLGLLFLIPSFCAPPPLPCEEEVIEKLMERCQRSAHYVHLMLLEARLLKRIYNIPIQVTMAIAILESDGTRSELAENANNFFGLTCSFDWPDVAPVYYRYHDGQETCFRVFSGISHAFKGFGDFIMSRERPWYEDARNCEDNANCWIDGLSEFAVDTAWCGKVKYVIGEYQLFLLDET